MRSRQPVSCQRVINLRDVNTKIHYFQSANTTDGNGILQKLCFLGFYQSSLCFKKMDNKKLAFGKGNFIALGIGTAIVLIGFILMSGGESTASRYDSSIFDTRHIVIAPFVTFVGFVSIIYAIIRKPRD